MTHSWIAALCLTLAWPFTGSSCPLAQVTTQPENPWVEQLRSPDANARARAAKEIGKSSDPSTVPALAAALTDSSEKVRHEVIIALFNIRNPESLDAITKATQDGDPDIRGLAVQALVGYYTGQAPRTGFTGFLKKGWQRAKTRFAADNTRIDPGVVVAPKAISALQNVMNDAGMIDPAREAAKGLGILVAQPAAPDLVKAAHSPDEDLAREALNALAKIKDKSTGPQLLDLLDSPHKDVRRDAAVTVGILRTQEALPKLQALFETEADTKTREKALEGLAYLGNPVSTPIFVKTLWSENKTFRTAAAEGLARSADPQTLTEVERAVAVDKDASIKLAMQYAITALGKDDHLSAIIDELSSKLRGELAQTYLIELTRDHPGALAKLYPYLNSQDADVRRRLCTVLMFTGDGTSVESLERLSRDPNGDVSTEALRALRGVRARLPASSPGPSQTGTPQ